MRSILPGGVRLITQSLPGNLSTSVGFWFGVGSRDEEPKQAGVSHFLEHLLFKGTKDRSAFQIAEAFDAVGAVSNAATSKEATYYWAHMVSEDTKQLLPVLVDMVSGSLLTEKDVEMERGVILDELAMGDDTPTDVVSETFARAVFGSAPLGRPVGGSPSSVSDLTGEELRDLYRSRYGTSDLTIAIAGGVDHEEVADLILEELERSPWAAQLGQLEPKPKRNVNVACPGGEAQESRRAGGMGLLEDLERNIWERRDVEQAHIITGGEWMGALDPNLPVSSVALNILGGGMSSRLFQEVREKRGLAYSTYSFAPAYFDTGYFGLYSGCAPKNRKEVEKLLWSEVEKLAEAGPTDWELQRTKGQMRGSVTLGLENSGSRMTRLARSEMVGQFLTVQDALERVEAVSKEDVQEVAKQMLSVPRSTAVVTTHDE